MLQCAHRPVMLLLATASGCLLLTGVAQAQVAAGGGGPRYLSWANRPADTTPGDVAAARTRARDGMIPRRVAPSQTIQRPSMMPAPLPAPTSGSLTPASAWLGPRVTPPYASGSPDPSGFDVEVAAQAPVPPVSPAYAPPPPRVSPAPASIADDAPVDDPMAPRRDAPIFRLQPQGPAAAQPPSAQSGQVALQAHAQATPARAGQQGARYYSVHRSAGRQPDPTVMPEPVFFDSVTLDLAEPPATEPLMRDAQGRRRTIAEPSLP